MYARSTTPSNKSHERNHKVLKPFEALFVDVTSITQQVHEESSTHWLLPAWQQDTLSFDSLAMIRQFWELLKELITYIY
jgi:hypothetical protein